MSELRKAAPVFREHFEPKDRELAPGIWRNDTRLGGSPTIGRTQLGVASVAAIYARAIERGSSHAGGIAATRQAYEPVCLTAEDVERCVLFDAGARWQRETSGAERFAATVREALERLDEERGE